MRLLGLAFVTGGGVVIGLGWFGAAAKDCVQCQIPYLLSGGAAGLALIVFGVALLLLAQVRTESRRLGDRIEQALRREGSPRAAESSRQEPSRPLPEAARAEEPRAESTPAPSRPKADPLRAVPVDLPPDTDDAEATTTEPPETEAATIAASTMAGGVVDTEADSDMVVDVPVRDPDGATRDADAESDPLAEDMAPMAPEPEFTAGDGPAESSETARVDPIVAGESGAEEPQLVRGERATTGRRGFFRRRRPAG